MRPSIKDIAKNLGIAPSSVSRALSGRSGVSEQTRRAVIRAAEELGYRPHFGARALRRGGSSSLGVIVEARPTEITNARNYALFAAADSAFERVQVVVRASAEPLEIALRRSVEAGSDAIVLSGVGRDSSPSPAVSPGPGRTAGAYAGPGPSPSPAVSSGPGARIDIPVCAIDTVAEVEKLVRGPVDRVEIDRSAGTYAVAAAFRAAAGGDMNLPPGASSGDRGGTGLRPLYLTRAAVNAPDERLSGILRSYAEAGVELPEASLYRLPATGSPAELAEKLDRTLFADRLPEQPSAVFCYDDNIAISLLRELVRHGRSVPEEVRLVGFDNLSVTARLPVSLSTVAQPVEEAVAEALSLLESRRREPDRPAAERVFPTRLIRRESF
jgi:DNA-binding LacI/PurR family transcriptional regulator